MRSFIVLFGFFIASPCAAVSFHSPLSSRERAEFQKAQKYISKIAKINHNIDDTIENNALSLTTKTTQIANWRHQQLPLYDKAIHAVIAAYGINPEHITGTLVGGGEFKGKEATWAPAFGNIKSRSFKDYRGREVSVPPLDKASAMTWVDGQIVIGKDFFGSPALLAAGIIHETVHFEQFTTPGQGPCKPYDPTCELEAYKIELSAINALGLTPQEVHKIGTGMRDQMEQIKKKSGSTPFSVLDPEPTKKSGDDDFINSLNKMRDVSKKAKDIAKKISDDQEKERLAREQKENSKEREWLATEKARNDAAWNYIKTAVGLACSNPQAFSDQISAKKIIDAALDDDELWYHLYEAKNEVGWESLSKGINSCQDHIVNQILSAPNPVPASLVLTWARQYREDHPSLIKRFVTTVSDFFAALEEFLNSIAPHSSSAQGGGNGGGQSAGGGGNGGSHIHYHDGEAAGQLRGIASGSMSFDGGF